jgi:nucleoside-diphosphate-sugar epimerase
LSANADVRFGTEHPRLDLEQNTIATYNVLEAMRANQIKKIAFSSTGSVYGEAPVVPTPEDGAFPIQTSLYGASKAALFHTLSNYLPMNSIEFAWCRLFYVYGEHESSERLIPKIKSQLGKGEKVELSNGIQMRDFMDVVQVGRVIASIALGSKVGPINVCSGNSVSVRQIAEKIADDFGRRDLLDFDKHQDKNNSHHFIVGVPNYD